MHPANDIWEKSVMESIRNNLEIMMTNSIIGDVRQQVLLEGFGVHFPKRKEIGVENHWLVQVTEGHARPRAGPWVAFCHGLQRLDCRL